MGNSNETVLGQMLGWGEDDDSRARRADMETEILDALVAMPEWAFKWDESKQVYVCFVGEIKVELRKSSYEGLKHLRERKKKIGFM